MRISDRWRLIVIILGLNDFHRFPKLTDSQKIGIYLQEQSSKFTLSVFVSGHKSLPPPAHISKTAVHDLDQ
jgi:hypothetical protein